MTCTAVVSGIPAAMAAARASYAPLGVSTVPTVISPIRAGSIADRAMDCYEITVSFEAYVVSVRGAYLEHLEKQLF